ncbi:uncharacterized protein LOC110181921 [Drosophila serrata]|uniref:uncharacterized protein LOC110181921 n=1 Tax=Drosophila serrata TaxID=7274 RepID=UPI000A1D243D|nr:uncharacterized protein LOC110181921 [Drosophila serrata]KAH8376299.1 hypothetical protein KR200_000375 [Drosophila serrata]
MFPFRSRLNQLRTDRRLRQRLRDAGIPTGAAMAATVAATVAAAAAAAAATETETPMGPDMRTVAAVHPLLVSLHHVRWLLIHLRHLLIRQRVGMILGAGDNMFVWNRREPSIATGQMGEGDCIPEMDLEMVAMIPED